MWLQTQLANTIAIEATIERIIDKLLPTVSENAEAATIFQHLQALSHSQRQTLEVRLRAIAENMPIPDSTGAVLAASKMSEYPISAALQTIYTLLNQAVISYSTLQVLALRSRDSWIAANEGTTAHLARQHTQDYGRAIQQISRALQRVVVWELGSEKLECQCTCPSCSLGVCLCAVASRTILSDALKDTGPMANDEGIYVQTPKQGSVAAQAGLRNGDVILSADGQPIKSYVDLQNAIRNHAAGETILLKARRGTGELQEMAIVRQ